HLLHLSFFFNAPPTSPIYTLSLHDALPISFDPEAYRVLAEDPKTVAIGECGLDYYRQDASAETKQKQQTALLAQVALAKQVGKRSEEHTSELQSPYDLVCRLLLEKKKKKKK